MLCHFEFLLRKTFDSNMLCHFGLPYEVVSDFYLVYKPINVTKTPYANFLFNYPLDEFECKRFGWFIQAV